MEKIQKYKKIMMLYFNLPEADRGFDSFLEDLTLGPPRAIHWLIIVKKRLIP